MTCAVSRHFPKGVDTCVILRKESVSSSVTSKAVVLVSYRHIMSSGSGGRET